MKNSQARVACGSPNSPTPNEPEGIQGPAIRTRLHIQDRDLYDEKTGAMVIGKKGIRRIDGLRWLLDHKSIGEHQFQAGRRLQQDYEMSRIEPCARLTGGGGGSPSSVLADSVLDAGTRYKDAMAVIPTSLVTLITLFLLPEHHPLSLERCGEMVKRDRKAAAFGIQIGLDLLARHYGYAT